MLKKSDIAHLLGRAENAHFHETTRREALHELDLERERAGSAIDLPDGVDEAAFASRLSNLHEELDESPEIPAPGVPSGEVGAVAEPPPEGSASVGGPTDAGSASSPEPTDGAGGKGDDEPLF